jgi:putative tricarboxylic transport membrane protein
MHDLAQGFQVAISPELLLAAFIGCFAGTLLGVLPGLGSTAGAALVLPLTYTLSPTASLTMIASIYAGSMYGGSTTSVLMNMPGEASSVVATIDGYQMTRKGRAGAALSIMAVGSFIAGTVGLILVSVFAPMFANVSLEFGPPEYFALAAGGLVVLARMSGGSAMSGLFPMMIGVVLATIGQDAISGTNRFTFGHYQLALGVNLVPIAVGVYGLSELIFLLEERASGGKVVAPRMREMFPTRQEWKRSVAPWTRGSFIGFLFGLLPGPSGTLSSFASYRVERAVSKHRHELGTGAVEGIAGPEAANNSAAIGALVPVMSLGIPFSATLAVMISAMIAQGITPGPLLVTQHPDVFWGVVVAMYIGNIMLLILNLPLVGLWVSILRIPQRLLLPGIAIISVIGAYGLRESMVDVYVLLAAGVLGYVLRKLDFSMASLVVGLVLGPLIEKNFREGLTLSHGSLTYFVSSPFSATVWIVVALITFWTLFSRFFFRKGNGGSGAGSLTDDPTEDGTVEATITRA